MYCTSRFIILLAADEKEFRNLVLWLEDQKIRHYKIEERKGLRETDAADWNGHLKTVCSSTVFEIKSTIIKSYQK